MRYPHIFLLLLTLCNCFSTPLIPTEKHVPTKVFRWDTLDSNLKAKSLSRYLETLGVDVPKGFIMFACDLNSDGDDELFVDLRSITSTAPWAVIQWQSDNWTEIGHFQGCFSIVDAHPWKEIVAVHLISQGKGFAEHFKFRNGSYFRFTTNKVSFETLANGSITIEIIDSNKSEKQGTAANP